MTDHTGVWGSEASEGSKGRCKRFGGNEQVLRKPTRVDLAHHALSDYSYRHTFIFRHVERKEGVDVHEKVDLTAARIPRVIWT